MLNPRYQAALTALARPIPAAALPRTLAPVERLLAALSHPEAAGPRITIAGSVGKGSAALALTRALAGAGRRVALYTSPHLHVFRERLQISGRMIAPERFAALAERVLGAADALGYTPSTFEATTALALCWFAEEAPDVQVCEIGLGGRFDAVNAAPHQLAVITPIEMEHAAMLGPTQAEIAWHKAGILRPGGLALSLPQSPAVMAVLEAEAQALGARLQIVPDPPALCGAALDALGIAPAGLDRADEWPSALPGRLERVPYGGRTVLVDGAHTPLGAARLARVLGAEAGSVGLVLAFLSDKQILDCLEALDQPGFTLLLTGLDDPRAAEPALIARSWTPRRAALDVQPRFEAALERALTFAAPAVGGSLRAAALAREALGMLAPALLEESRWTRTLFTSPAYRSQMSIRKS